LSALDVFGIPATLLLFPPHAGALALVFAVSGEPAKEQAPRIEALVLDVETIPSAELDAALELRLPDRPRMPAGDPSARKKYELYAYVQIRPDGSGWMLAVILPGGRAYYRELEGDAELIPRIAASNLANLIAGIEADTVRPDEEDVPIPDLEPPPVVTPPPVAPPRPPVVVPRPELGLRFGGGTVLAVPPPPRAGLAAGGGEIGLEFRSPAGALAALAVRGAARVEAGYSLARIRIAALGGYAFRRGDFELIAAAGITAEPFFLRRSGGREPLTRDVSGEQRASFLLGGVARLAPGWRRAVSPRVAFRIGPALEIGGSAIPSANGGVARIRTIGPNARDLFRAGGLEIFAGLDLGVWWTIGRPVARRTGGVAPVSGAGESR
jgi:hypothetical protein